MQRIRLAIISTLTATASVFTLAYTSCTPVSKCDVVCNNGGTCTENNCICPSAYSGTHCDELSFTGSWRGTDNPASMPAYTQTIVITPGSTGATMSLSFVAGQPAGKTITGVLNNAKTTITFYKQLIATSTSVPDTISGTIQLLNSTLATSNYTYNNVADGVNYTINGNYSKQ